MNLQERTLYKPAFSWQLVEDSCLVFCGLGTMCYRLHGKRPIAFNHASPSSSPASPHGEAGNVFLHHIQLLLLLSILGIWLDMGCYLSWVCVKIFCTSRWGLHHLGTSLCQLLDNDSVFDFLFFSFSFLSFYKPILRSNMKKCKNERAKESVNHWLGICTAGEPEISSPAPM